MYANPLSASLRYKSVTVQAQISQIKIEDIELNCKKRTLPNSISHVLHSHQAATKDRPDLRENEQKKIYT